MENKKVDKLIWFDAAVAEKVETYRLEKMKADLEKGIIGNYSFTQAVNDLVRKGLGK